MFFKMVSGTARQPVRSVYEIDIGIPQNAHTRNCFHSGVSSVKPLVQLEIVAAGQQPAGCFS